MHEIFYKNICSTRVNFRPRIITVCMKALILILRTIKYFFEQLFSNFTNRYKYKTSYIDGNTVFTIPTDYGNFLVPNHNFNDIIYTNIKKNLIYDRFIADLMIEYYYKSTNKGLILDVGANIGQMSLYIANSIANSNHKELTGPVLISVEAEPLLYKLLTINIQNNLFSSVIESHNIIAWSAQTLVNFPIPDLKKFSSWGSYGVEPLKGSKDRLLKANTIDSIVNNRNVSIIKLDIQGSEFDALQGCLQTITKSKPVIIFEFEYGLSKSLGKTFKDYLSLIENYDYKFLDIRYPNFIIGPN
jgi:FkbM family methyltransferase